MMRKRPLIYDIYDKKRRKLNNNDIKTCDDTPTDTGSALKHISAIFPVEKFKNRLPPIVMRHQLYAFVKSKTEVDRHLNELRKQGEIRLFKLGIDDNHIAVVYFNDYHEYCKRICKNNYVVCNFLNTVVKDCPDISYSIDTLKNSYGLNDEKIKELLQQGVLNTKSVGCFWLYIPGVGDFIKTFIFGHRATLQYVRRTKYKEILQSELVHRKLPRKAVLGILYHIYDVIGTETVICIETSTGIVLRLQPEVVSK